MGKKKVTKYTAEITMSELCSDGYIDEFTDCDDIHDVKVLKIEDVEIDEEED